MLCCRHWTWCRCGRCAAGQQSTGTAPYGHACRALLRRTVLTLSSTSEGRRGCRSSSMPLAFWDCCSTSQNLQGLRVHAAASLHNGRCPRFKAGAVVQLLSLLQAAQTLSTEINCTCCCCCVLHAGRQSWFSAQILPARAASAGSAARAAALA